MSEPLPTGRTGRAFVLLGIVVLAFNLRPAAVSVGPVLDDITDGLGMSGTVAGVLTSLPVLAFAGFGALAPRIARRTGPHRLTLIALICVVVGLWSRSLVHSIPAFLLLSLLALAGMATANVLLPSLVKLHFPDRVGTLTAIYSTALAIGLTCASLFTVPLGDAYGGWRGGLRFWAFTAIVAVIPWVLLSLRDRGLKEPGNEHRISFAHVARTRTGRLMALFFGLQSLHAYAIFGWFAAVYHDAGFSSHTAGLLLGVITGTSIPLSFLIPRLAARMTNQTVMVWALVLPYPVGYIGLAYAPHNLAILWAVIIGAATCTFPLVLTLIGLRARTPAGTAALSGFTQSVGYLISVIGPFGFGALHQLSGGWRVPLWALTVLTIPLLITGLAVARPTYVEDELA
jgi:CP family cyanate transporter-like MFS transporter